MSFQIFANARTCVALCCPASGPLSPRAEASLRTRRTCPRGSTTSCRPRPRRAGAMPGAGARQPARRARL